MPDLIDKIEALGKLQSMYIQIECACGDGNPVAKGVRKAYKAIERMPAIKPEVRHGRWECGGFCSECGLDNEERKTDYCPNCGAKMDLRTQTGAQLDESD